MYLCWTRFRDTTSTLEGELVLVLPGDAMIARLKVYPCFGLDFASVYQIKDVGEPDFHLTCLSLARG
jgi:hypothetical protein